MIINKKENDVVESAVYIEETLDENGDSVHATFYGYNQPTKDKIQCGLLAGRPKLNMTNTEFPTVIEVQDFAFWGDTSLSLTQLPDTIKTIGSSAFFGCTNLSLTKLPDSLTSLKGAAFYNCSNVEFEEFPVGLKNITNDSVFYNCAKAKFSQLPSQQGNIPTTCFLGCSSCTFSTLPYGITTIGESAFQGCSSVTFSSFPATLTTIGKNAFTACTAMNITALHEGITTIGNGAFADCQYGVTLTSLPSSLTEIGTQTFKGTRINLSVVPSTVASIKAQGFQNCLAQGPNLEVAAGELNDWCFYNNTALEAVWIRKSCHTIKMSAAGKSPFYNCSNLSKLSKPGIIYVEWEENEVPSTWASGWNQVSASDTSTYRKFANVVYGVTSSPW